MSVIDTVPVLAIGHVGSDAIDEAPRPADGDARGRAHFFEVVAHLDRDAVPQIMRLESYAVTVVGPPRAPDGTRNVTEFPVAVSTSHLAALARERGVPAVLGVPEATRRIPDGAQVAVDGIPGIVRWTQ